LYTIDKVIEKLLYSAWIVLDYTARPASTDLQYSTEQGDKGTILPQTFTWKWSHMGLPLGQKCDAVATAVVTKPPLEPLVELQMAYDED